MNAPVRVPNPTDTLETLETLETHEGVFAILTAWLRAPGKSRELKLETISIGLTCKLFESNQLQATGRGTSADDAIAEALTELGLS